MKTNFIQHQVISLIVNKWLKKGKLLNHSGFFYFDTPPIHNKIEIDRIGRGFIFCRDETIPLHWENVSGKTLMHILSEINNNNIYIYKEFEKRFYKTRLRNDIK